jgi:hypothetical protein
MRWGSGLIAGFAEQQESLFDAEPVTIRTIDHEAEAANADAYRDLLREIDRAFAGFDRSAARHGWLDDYESDGNTDPTGMRRQVLAGIVDLPDFVAGAIKAEGRRCASSSGALQIPADWRGDLDGLPGYERTNGTFRFTRDHARLRDGRGRSLGVLGRTHPLVRRAISRAHTMSAETYDSRVSVVHTNAEEPLAVLLTYIVDLRGPSRIELQQLIAMLLPEDGEVVEFDNPGRWLRYTNATRAAAAPDAWRRLFAHWVPQRESETWSVARAAMR